MKQWGDRARAEVFVYWKAGGAHVFIAENVGGKIEFICPQTGERDFGKRFSDVLTGKTEVCRIDTLEPSPLITECCEPARRGGA